MVLLNYLLLHKASLRAIELCWKRLPGWRLCLWERRVSARGGETQRALVPGACVSFSSSRTFVSVSFLRSFLLPTLSASPLLPASSLPSCARTSDLGGQRWQRAGSTPSAAATPRRAAARSGGSERAGSDILAGTTFPTPGQTVASWSWKMTLPPDTLGLLMPWNHWAEKGVWRV